MGSESQKQLRSQHGLYTVMATMCWVPAVLAFGTSLDVFAAVMLRRTAVGQACWCWHAALKR
jgi:hypothetical protein